MADKRYIRNIPAISEAEQEILKSKKVAVIGCGGLGGFVIEYLVRLGLGEIIAVDGDSFDESNLNRQLLCTEAGIGKSKADAAKERAEAINSDVKIKVVSTFLDETNADDLIKGADLIIDALDNVSARFALEDAAAKAGITIVHGAVAGWNMQIAIAEPGKNTLHKLYENKDASEAQKSCLVMAPACCASIEVSKAIQLLLGQKTGLEGEMFAFDLSDLSSLSFGL